MNDRLRSGCLISSAPLVTYYDIHEKNGKNNEHQKYKMELCEASIASQVIICEKSSNTLCVIKTRCMPVITVSLRN